MLINTLFCQKGFYMKLTFSSLNVDYESKQQTVFKTKATGTIASDKALFSYQKGDNVVTIEINYEQPELQIINHHYTLRLNRHQIIENQYPLLTKTTSLYTRLLSFDYHPNQIVVKYILYYQPVTKKTQPGNIVTIKLAKK